jgi:hypothetical protein
MVSLAVFQFRHCEICMSHRLSGAWMRSCSLLTTVNFLSETLPSSQKELMAPRLVAQCCAQQPKCVDCIVEALLDCSFYLRRRVNTYRHNEIRSTIIPSHSAASITASSIPKRDIATQPSLSLIWMQSIGSLHCWVQSTYAYSIH